MKKEQNAQPQNNSGNAAKLFVSGSVEVKPKKEPHTKECGACWGGGKIEVSDLGDEVDCWTCGGSGRLKI